MAPIPEHASSVEAGLGGRDDIEHLAEGLATALQFHEDIMEERLERLVKEQSALLAKLGAARKVSSRD